MKSPGQKMVMVLWVLAVVLCFTTAVAASDAVIQGVVTDANGKPIRGAVVRATAGPKSVIRYSQVDGHYEIAVPSGSYDVTADAWGFAPKKQAKDTTQAGATDFKLTPKIDVTRLSSAEIEGMLPDTDEGKMIKTTCSGCHAFQTVLTRRGSTAAEWAAFLPTMTDRRFQLPMWSPERVAAYSRGLEKYFGPDAPYFGPDADAPDASLIKHTNLSDAALKATIREYNVPTTGAMAHSITVDQKSGMVWFSEYDYLSNKIARFNPNTEKFDEFPLPVAKALPHTGVVLKDGGYIVALAQYNIPAKLATVDTASNVKIYEWAENKAGGHTATLDPTGNYVWMTTTAEDEVWRFDLTKKEFRAYKYPLATAAPEGSQAALEIGPRGRVSSGAYDVTIDSKGIAWVSQLALGNIIRIDPETGATKTYHTAGVRSVRGLTSDAQGDIWFADFYGHKLGKLDVETGMMKEFQPPTPNAAPYGLVVDRNSGSIWYCDTVGNNIGRFDPKTEQFVEYALPTRNTSVRFMGVDAKGRGWYSGFWSGKIGVIDPEGSKQVAAAH